MKEKLSFRPALMSDLEEIVRIYNSTIPSRLVTADLEPVSMESRIPWFKKHVPDRRPLWVVESDGGIVGWVGLLPFHERIAYDATAEVSIYLDEKARGKGFGREILRFVLSVSPELGIENLVGLIFDHNEPSLHLFSTMGFSEWAHLPEVANLDGVKRGLKILGRKI